MAWRSCGKTWRRLATRSGDRRTLLENAITKAELSRRPGRGSPEGEPPRVCCAQWARSSRHMTTARPSKFVKTKRIRLMVDERLAISSPGLVNANTSDRLRWSSTESFELVQSRRVGCFIFVA